MHTALTKALFHVADLSRVYLYSRSVHTPLPPPPLTIETPSTCLYSTSCCFLCIYSFSCHCQDIHLLHCFALFLFGNGNYGTVPYVMQAPCYVVRICKCSCSGNRQTKRHAGVLVHRQTGRQAGVHKTERADGLTERHKLSHMADLFLQYSELKLQHRHFLYVCLKSDLH